MIKVFTRLYHFSKAALSAFNIHNTNNVHLIKFLMFESLDDHWTTLNDVRLAQLETYIKQACCGCCRK